MAKDSRVKLFSQANSGVGVARCRGIHESTGDYIAFCDSDDWFEPNYLKEHMSHLEKYNAEISMCRTYISGSRDLDNNGEIIIKEKSTIVKDYLRYNGISVSLWDKVFLREVLDNEEIYNNYRYSEDLYMNYVACKYANRLVGFNTTKYNWYNNPVSLSRESFNPEKLKCDFNVWEKIITDCKHNYPDLEEIARLSSELWICGTFRLMVVHHYHDKKQEKRIAKYVRQDGVKVLKVEKNARNKVFLCFAYVSFPLARGIWYTMNSCKTVLKKIIKRKNN